MLTSDVCVQAHTHVHTYKQIHVHMTCMCPDTEKAQLWQGRRAVETGPLPLASLLISNQRSGAKCSYSFLQN